MGALTIYAIKSAICLALLYIPYTLLLRKETLFAVNRFGLLAITVLSLLLPAMDIQVWDNSALDGINRQGRAIIEVGMPTPDLAASQADAVTTAATGGFSISWAMAVVLIYIIGVVVTLTVKGIDFGRMIRSIGKGALWQEQHDGATIYIMPEGASPFSWMHTVIISENDYRTNRDVLTHELAHVSSRHSLDILFVTLAEAFQWFNPCVWMLANSLCEVHEYEADDAVLRSGSTLHDYQMLLIKKAVGTSSYAFANSFNHSLLKKRITMMMKTNHSSKWSSAKYLYVLPVAAIALGAFANTNIEKATAEVTNVTIDKVKDFASNEQAISQKNAVTADELAAEMAEMQSAEALEQAEADGIASKDTITKPVEIIQAGEDIKPAQSDDKDSVTFMIVEEMPEFPGGAAALMQFIAQNIKYPASAQEIGLEGRVIVSFKVKKDGSLADFEFVSMSRQDGQRIEIMKETQPSEISPVAVNGYKKLPADTPVTEADKIEYATKYNKAKLDCGNEVMRVFSIMPKWKPGKQRGEEVNVKYTIPVMFRLR